MFKIIDRLEAGEERTVEMTFSMKFNEWELFQNTETYKNLMRFFRIREMTEKGQEPCFYRDDLESLQLTADKSTVKVSINGEIHEHYISYMSLIMKPEISVFKIIYDTIGGKAEPEFEIPENAIIELNIRKPKDF